MEDSFTGHVCSSTPAKHFVAFLTLPVLRAEPQHQKPPPRGLLRLVGREVTVPPSPQQQFREAVRALPTSFLGWLRDARLQS